LLKRFRDREEQRLEGMAQFGVWAKLERSGRLRAGISPAEAVEMMWALCGPDQYTQLVFERGWTPSRYEQWLADAMINSLLEPPRNRSRAAVR